METETLDKLYLEWSQFTKARTARELALLKALQSALGQWAMYADMHEREDERCRLADEKSAEGDLYRHCHKVLNGDVGTGKQP